MTHPVARLLAIAATAGLALTLAAPADAKSYTRSCKATIGYTATTPSGVRLGGGSAAFTGKGTVGWYAPNTARERARENIDECLAAAWANRDVNNNPAACRQTNQIYNYPYPNGLNAGLTRVVCRANPGHDRVLIDLSVLFEGQTGCTPNNSWGQTIARRYVIDCSGFSETPLH